MIEVDVGPLQPERFPGAQSRQNQNDKKCAPGLSRERENRFDLRASEVCRDVSIIIRKCSSGFLFTSSAHA
jgi:hypothetical protein